jgi:hypothetical protein
VVGGSTKVADEGANAAAEKVNKLNDRDSVAAKVGGKGAGAG